MQEFRELKRNVRADQGIGKGKGSHAFTRREHSLVVRVLDSGG